MASLGGMSHVLAGNHVLLLMMELEVYEVFMASGEFPAIK